MSSGAIITIAKWLFIFLAYDAYTNNNGFLTSFMMMLVIAAEIYGMINKRDETMELVKTDIITLFDKTNELINAVNKLNEKESKKMNN